MNYLMGIDNGGTFSKAAIFDTEGSQIAVASLPTRVLTPKSGYTERDMEELWQTNAQVIRAVLEKSGIRPSDIAGVSLSGHGKGLYVVDTQGNPVCSGILSTDTRAWEYPVRWRREGVLDKVFEKTCQTVLACQPVSLLAWMKDHVPEAYDRIGTVFSVKDYVRYRLTGVRNGEYTDFSGGNLINMKTGTYDRELMELFGIGGIYDRLPPLKESAEICGGVTRESGRLTGLLEGTPVAAGMFDVNACGIASGLVSEKDLCMIAGTWSINEFLARSPIVDGSVSLNSMFCIPGYYLIEESSPTSAGNLEWFIRTQMPMEQETWVRAGLYERINRMVSEIRPEESDLIFLPFLNGSNEDPQARGTFVGLTGYHDRRHMLRAIYEGVVFSHMTHVRRLLRNRERPESIRLSGGAANSEVWVQIFADALQIPVDVVEGKELGAQGAAMAAGIGAGIYADYQEAAARTVRITKTVVPSPESGAVYEKKYQAYRLVNDAMAGIWSKLK